MKTSYSVKICGEAVNNEYLTIDDLKDLPPELIAQLNISESDKKAMSIIEIVKQRQPVCLDIILVDLWKNHGVVEDRQKLMARMYRLSVKGLVATVEGRKGIYEIPSGEKQ